MDIVTLSFIFLVSIGLLVKSSDYFTDAAESIGRALGAPPFIIGVTIVAFGTSLPELVSSIVAVFAGSSEIVIGNVVGSNIANVFFILGVTAIIAKKIKIDFDIIRVDLPFLLGSALLLALAVLDGAFTWPEGLLFLVGALIYVAYTVHSEQSPKDKRTENKLKGELPKKTKRVETKPIFILILSGVGIYIGAKFTIDAVVGIAESLAIGTEVIATTAVALGTSLPELFVSATAALKKKPEIAIGNILGSNIFNIFFITGATSLFGALMVPASILVFALPAMISATLLFLFISLDREVTSWEGWLLVVFYAFFVGKVIGFI